MKSKNLISFVVLIVILATQIARTQIIEITPGELIVRYKENATGLQKVEIEEKYGLSKIKDVEDLNVTLYQVDQNNVINIMCMIGKEGVIEYSEPNYVMKIKSVPNDIYYNSQWYLSNIGMPNAWNNYTGSTVTKVAIIDTGVNKLHNEIMSKLTAAGEWDYVDSDSDATDEGSTGHGSLIAGIVAAQKNNANGVAGIAENVAILPIRVGDSDGNVNMLNAAEAIRRAVDNGCRVINCSFAGPVYITTVYYAISYANDHNALVICAAGNESVNNEVTHSYPSDYDLPNIISVASSGASNNLSVFSNYGSTSVDLAAPGENIFNCGGGLYSLVYWGFDYGWDDWSQLNYSGFGFSWNSIYQGLFTSVDLWGYYSSNSTTYLTSPTVDCSGFKKTKVIINVGGNIGIGDVLGIYSLTSTNALNNIGYLRSGLTNSEYTYDSSAQMDLQGSNKLSILFTSDYYYNSYFGIKDVRVTGIPGTISMASSQYKTDSGTSFSAPLVSGVAAMLMSQNPNLSSLEIKSIIMNTAKKSASMTGKTVTGGILDANAAMQYVTSIKSTQTINFAAISAKTYGDAPFALSAIATSGLAVEYISSNINVASVSGGYLVVKGAGSAQITALQAGNSLYDATSLTQTLYVSPKALTIVANPITKNYGSVDPALTYSASGLVGADALSGGLSRNLGESVGTYSILLGTLSPGPNYTVSYTTASLTITPNYSSWASSFTLTGNNTLQSADPDNDGLNNAAEYAFGSNPLIPNGGSVSVSSLSGAIKCIWLQRKDHTQVAYFPKTASDLSLAFNAWSSLQSVLSSPQPTGLDSNYEQVEAVLPAGTGKCFMKVQAVVY